MAMYTFYPSREDGRPITFEAFELTNDDAAYAQAEVILRRHVTCCQVEVWRDGHLLPERPVAILA